MRLLLIVNYNKFSPRDPWRARIVCCDCSGEIEASVARLILEGSLSPCVVIGSRISDALKGLLFHTSGVLIAL